MKKLLPLLIGIVVFAGCKPDEAIKGVDNFNIALNSDIFKYRMYLKITDENGAPVKNADIALLGDDAEYIYNEFGTREFTTNNSGEITFTLHPSYEPLENDPIEFQTYVKADGYEKGTSTITVGRGQYDISQDIGIWSLQGLKDKLGLEVTPLSGSNGAVTGNTVVSKKQGTVQVVDQLELDSIYYDNNDVSIIIEDGARFYYYKRVYNERPIYKKVTNEIMDTIKVNGELVPLVVEETVIVDTIWEKTFAGWERAPYSGDEIEIHTYPTGYGNDEYQFGVDPSYDKPMSAMFGEGYSSQSKLVAVTKAQYAYVTFEGVLPEGNPVIIYPMNASNSIIYSYAVDESAFNPITETTIKEGDSIETGKYFVREGGDYVVKTRKSVVHRAGNGQLRVQGYDQKYGFFKFFPYENVVDIELQPNIPDTSIVPDLENLRYYYSAYLPLAGGNKVYLNYSGSGSAKGLSPEWNYHIRRTIFSDKPAGEAVVKFWNGYWGNKWEENRVHTGSLSSTSIFSERWKSQDYNELTTYRISVVCALNDSMKLNPTATASSEIGGYPVYVYIRDGRWATRGVALGDSMKFNIDYKNWSLDTSFVLSRPRNVIEYVDETGMDVCNM